MNTTRISASSFKNCSRRFYWVPAVSRTRKDINDASTSQSSTKIKSLEIYPISFKGRADQGFEQELFSGLVKDDPKVLKEKTFNKSKVTIQRIVVKPVLKNDNKGVRDLSDSVDTSSVVTLGKRVCSLETLDAEEEPKKQKLSEGFMMQREKERRTAKIPLEKTLDLVLKHKECTEEDTVDLSSVKQKATTTTLSPEKALRFEMLRIRFGDTILRANEKMEETFQQIHRKKVEVPSFVVAASSKKTEEVGFKKIHHEKERLTAGTALQKVSKEHSFNKSGVTLRRFVVKPILKDDSEVIRDQSNQNSPLSKHRSDSSDTSSVVSVSQKRVYPLDILNGDDESKNQRLSKGLEIVGNQRHEKAKVTLTVVAASKNANGANSSRSKDADIKKQRQQQREIARSALEKMEKTASIYDSHESMMELESLAAGSPSNIFQTLGLVLKRDEYTEDDMLDVSMKNKAQMRNQSRISEEANLKKIQREKERETARIALQKVEMTAKIHDNHKSMMDLIALAHGYPLRSFLVRLGLNLKDEDYNEEEEEKVEEEMVCSDIEEGEIVC